MSDLLTDVAPTTTPAPGGDTPAVPSVDPANTSADVNVDVTNSVDPVEPDYSGVKAPEGSELDVTVLEKATPIFKELGLNKDQAQKLVDFYAGEVSAIVEQQRGMMSQTQEKWLESTRADKEIGGGALDQSVQLGKLALQKFGTPELTTLLNEFGLGNNPEVIRFMSRVGRLTKEDVPGGSGSPTAGKLDRVSILYPNQ